MQPRSIGLLIARICLFAVATPARAQMVGSRDLTSEWRAPEERVPAPNPKTCERVSSSIASGVQTDSATAAGGSGRGLKLEILGISPPELQLDDDFLATVRLKNIGRTSLSIPWTADGEQVARVSSDGTEERYEVADISFRLESGTRPRMPVFLESQGALFAHPENRQSYLSLAPGAWVEIKMKATVTCGLENCLGSIQPDDRAVLTAWWYQRVLIHRVSGCEERHGSSTIRELDSIPFAVVVRAPSPPASDDTDGIALVR